ncbi:hypothetical protein HaLaN_22734 [Haematococcus lacustris]|uniref:Uncharacterized protein n=1 Tax=Haematococcus lacustris TaxID=44745 RepID=A0A6A0A0G1_HAELA|nr:hypothetical protein HaLaN_22734 [Haematococcus lacustris]
MHDRLASICQTCCVFAIGTQPLPGIGITAVQASQADAGHEGSWTIMVGKSALSRPVVSVALEACTAAKLFCLASERYLLLNARAHLVMKARPGKQAFASDRYVLRENRFTGARNMTIDIVPASSLQSGKVHTGP